jgi:hypothetical protein
MEQTGADRREFFRINDTVIVEYTIIQQDEVDEAAERIHDAELSNAASEKIQLRSIQNNLNHVLDSINQSDREVARALRLLDEKINLLTQTIQREASPVDPEETVKANLSGGGIAFMVDQQLNSRQSVEIYLKLLPSSTSINALASVVSCDKIQSDDPSHPYLLRLVFTHMDEQDRNLLVKHTLNRQAEALRSGRRDGAMSVHEF